MCKMGLWVHVCVRQFPPTSALRSNCIAEDSLATPHPPAGHGALSYIGNLCWRVPEWSWGAFEPYSKNGHMRARLRESASAHKCLKVKLHHGGFLSIPLAPRRRRCTKLHREPILTRPWMELGGLWALWSKWASGCRFACVSSRPQVTKGQTASLGIPWHPLSPPQSAVH